jgi:hypothetical protein
MEPERPKVDRKVLDFVKGHVFDPADFVIRTDDVCRLNAEMSRMVMVKASTQKISNAGRAESTLCRPSRSALRTGEKGEEADFRLKA